MQDSDSTTGAVYPEAAAGDTGEGNDTKQRATLTYSLHNRDAATLPTTNSQLESPELALHNYFPSCSDTKLHADRLISGEQ